MLDKKNIKKFKLNNLKVLQIVLILLFLSFLIFLFSAKNYQKEYKVNGVNIKEIYNKKNKYYYFRLTYKDINLDMLFDSKYKQNRGFIKKIDIIEDKDNFCLVPKGESFEFYPVCYDNKKVVSYNVVNNTLKNKLDNKYFKKDKLIDTYKDIEIYNQDYNYFIWNYDGFYFINKDKNKKIDIFNKEQYTVNLIGYTKDYLVIADYDSNYTFNNFYTIDERNGELTKKELDRDIYFDSYFLGYIKNKLYIVDDKESSMYEFNAKNGKLEKIKAKIYKDNKWVLRNIKTIIANKETFSYKTNYHYILEDNNLYINYKDINTLVSEDITNIVRINDLDIFYLKDDLLYHFNPYKGEELLLRYFEWHFNSNNMVYIN